MTIKTKFDLGDVVWHVNKIRCCMQKLTLGQVRVEVTNSPGYDGTIFDNFKKQSGRKESYMAMETGIGSGYVYNAEDLYAIEAEAREVQQVCENKKIVKMLY